MHSLHRVMQMAEQSAKTPAGLSRVQEVMFYDHYAERGYSLREGQNSIAMGNWNDISHWDDATHGFITDDDVMTRLARVLEKMGCELEWSDEWTQCDVCQGVMRTQPDGYGWQKAYYNLNGSDICEDCIKDDEGLLCQYLSIMEGNNASAVTIDLDLAEHGYIQLNNESFEHGLHPGQDASPREISKHLDAAGVTRYLFTLDCASQFDIEFSVWVHKDQYQQALKWWTHRKAGDCDGPSVSGAMQAALQAGTKAAAELPDDGIKVISCHADGTATARTITPQEFVEGKALST